MIRTRHHQPSLWTSVLAEEAEELWEPWMRTADRLLDDEQLVDRVLEAQAKRFLKSRTRGRKQTPAEVVTAGGMRSAVENVATPCPAKAYGKYCRPPLPRVGNT